MKYIKRAVENVVIEALDDHRIAILYGPRQVGKTTLATHIAAARDPNFRYLNCDEPDVAESLTNKTSTQLKAYLGDAKMVVVDEAQRVTNIGISLKLLADRFPEINIIATGSSVFELANKINEPLTGRAYYFDVLPLSLGELSSDPVEQSRLLTHVMMYGSYPVVALGTTSNIGTYLTNLCDNYLYRDLLSLGVIRSESIVRKLLLALALQVGGEVNVSELSRLLSVDFKTVSRLIDLLEKAFVIYRLYPLNRSIRKSITKQYKVYFIDLGVRNELIGNFIGLDVRSDIGALWENFCMNEIRKIRGVLSEPINTYFWRNYAGAEVDYIEERAGQIWPYEFKWGNKKPHLPKAFRDSFTTNELSVISRTDFHLLLN